MHELARDGPASNGAKPPKPTCQCPTRFRLALSIVPDVNAAWNLNSPASSVDRCKRPSVA